MYPFKNSTICWLLPLSMTDRDTLLSSPREGVVKESCEKWLQSSSDWMNYTISHTEVSEAEAQCVRGLRPTT